MSRMSQYFLYVSFRWLLVVEGCEHTNGTEWYSDFNNMTEFTC
jgi:hypothetical protein